MDQRIFLLENIEEIESDFYFLDSYPVCQRQSNEDSNSLLIERYSRITYLNN